MLFLNEYKYTQFEKEELVSVILASSGNTHEFHETCHSITSYYMKKDSKRFCDITMPGSIHAKDEGKRGSAFAIIFGVNWPVQLV